MSFGHRGLPQLHNLIKCQKKGVLVGELKAPIEVHFVDGVPHPTTLQIRNVPFQLGN